MRDTRDGVIRDQEDMPLLSVGPVRRRDRRQARQLLFGPYLEPIDEETGEEVSEKEAEEEN